jgi:hypothetical protein
LAYIFKHALTQDVAYNGLLIHRRNDLHRLVAMAIEELRINANRRKGFGVLISLQPVFHRVPWRGCAVGMTNAEIRMAKEFRMTKPETKHGAPLAPFSAFVTPAFFRHS